MKLLLISPLAIAACATVPAPSATLLWAGTTQEAGGTEVRDTASPTGFSVLNSERHLLSLSESIPATVGTSFGAGWVFEGAPNTKRVNYTVRWLFPPKGITNPTTGVQRFSTEVQSYCLAEKLCTTSWKLIEQWEAVPGVWRMEVWVGKRLTLGQNFNLVPQ